MWLVTVYVVGAIVGLLLTDGRPLLRLALALVWPLGPLACLLTVAGLIGVAAIAFPTFGVILALVAAGGWFWLR
jgi:hypothetical protein